MAVKKIISRTETMNQILEILDGLKLPDDKRPTNIPFLSFIKSSRPTTFNSGMLKPSFCLVVQGEKKILIGTEVVLYGMGSFIIATVDFPTSGQVVQASKSTPYYGISIELDANEVAEIAIEAKLNYEKEKSRAGAFIAKSDEPLQEVILRLLKLVNNDQDANFLAPALRRELIYRILRSPSGSVLYQNAVKDFQEAGIGKVIGWLKENYNRPLKMEVLAKEMSMSVSSLHHKFKTVTTMAPLQYQKHLRLQEARRLLLAENLDAATVSFKVGYESPSQFSREYKRLFGAPPLEDIKKLKSGTRIE